MRRGQLARFPVRPLWDSRPAAGAQSWMARRLDEMPWARGSHWPWGEMERQGREGLACCTASFPQIQETPTGPCV